MFFKMLFVLCVELSGIHTTICPSPCPSAEANTMQYANWRAAVYWSQRLEGLDILCSSPFGGLREWLSKAQHNISWGRPVQKGWPQAIQEAFQLFQYRLLQLLRWRAHCAYSSSMGSNTIGDGRRVRSIGGSHGHGLDKHDSWNLLLQEQAPSRQHLHPNCASEIASLLSALFVSMVMIWWFRWSPYFKGDGLQTFKIERS